MLAKNLARFRKRKGYSQKYVAELLHISPQAYHKYEKIDGRGTEPSTENLGKLADLYNVSVDELLGRLKKDDSSSEKDYFEEAEAIMFKDIDGFNELPPEKQQEIKDMINRQLKFFIEEEKRDS